MDIKCTDPVEGPEGHREVPIHEFYTGPGRTVRDRCEVCTGFIIKKEDYEGWYGQYIKYGKRKAMREMRNLRLCKYV